MYGSNMDTHTVKISRSIILEEERFVLILTEIGNKWWIPLWQDNKDVYLKQTEKIKNTDHDTSNQIAVYSGLSRFPVKQKKVSSCFEQ